MSFGQHGAMVACPHKTCLRGCRALVLGSARPDSQRVDAVPFRGSSWFDSECWRFFCLCRPDGRLLQLFFTQTFGFASDQRPRALSHVRKSLQPTSRAWTLIRITVSQNLLICHFIRQGVTFGQHGAKVAHPQFIAVTGICWPHM